MTVADLQQAMGLTEFCLPDPEREISGGYAGDLLSWVMGGAKAGNVWLTIMSNVNVAAVAMLTDVACVLLTEGVTPDADLLARAQAQGINLLGIGGTTFDAAAALHGLL